MLFDIEQWVLSHHAKTRQAERKITDAEIDRLLRSFDVCLRQGAKYILVKHFDGRDDNNMAVVIASGDKSLWVILTVMVNFQVTA